MSELESKRQHRKEMNERILAKGGKVVRRFMALDQQAYEDGMIPKEYKELMGLVASLVSRCEECIFYHLDQCVSHGITDEELDEAFGIALVVGGSVVIPHVRYAKDILAQMREETM